MFVLIILFYRGHQLNYKVMRNTVSDKACVEAMGCLFISCINMSSVVHPSFVTDFSFTDFSLIKGGLVKKILETKKDYESSPSAPKSRDQVGHLLILTPCLH